MSVELPVSVALRRRLTIILYRRTVPWSCFLPVYGECRVALEKEGLSLRTTSQWYKRSERQYRVALFFSAASLAGAFGGILAWGIGHMRGLGGLSGWRYDQCIFTDNHR